MKRKHHKDFKGYYFNNGYRMVFLPDNPKSGKSGFMYEHVAMAEKVLGKLLPPGAEVHHHGEKNDNTQLVICQDHAYHRLLHRRTKALKACGHANWRKCNFCKQYDKPENLYIHPNGRNAWHKHCAHNYYKRRKKQTTLTCKSEQKAPGKDRGRG